MSILRTRNGDDTKNSTTGEPIRRLNYAETMTLKGSVTKALNNSAIGKTYIKDLIERVAFNTNGTIISTNILELFMKVFESRNDDPIWGGIWIYRKSSTASSAGNYWDWVGGRGFAEIYLAFSGDLTYEQARLPEEQKTVPRYESLIRHLVDPYKGGMTAVHELMHIAVKGRHKGTSHPVGDDVDYADAAAALAGDENPNYTKVANKGSAGSAYWGERLHQACGYPSHLSHQFTDYKLYKFGLPVPTASPKNIAGKIGEEDKDANKSE